MEYLIDWANLLLRWAHVIFAIAWIGSSFYFVWLDNSLTLPEDAALRARGVSGELWAVHGGGFYHPTKYLGVPPRLPARLHWFYWESYSTWLSGFGLFTLLYLFQASTFLVDRSVFEWPSPLAAGAAAIGFLVVFWLVYDLICRAFGMREKADLLVGAMVFGTVVFASWLACRLFAGRAAFVLVGAMIATAMSANVFFRIIPGQRKLIAQMQAGQPADPVHGRQGKQRSVHNTYFTLPVLFTMISNHHGFLYQSPHNWMLLVLLMLAGAMLRHFFVARHKTGVAGRPAPWGWAVAGSAVLLGVAIWQAPTPTPTAPAVPAEAAVPPSFAEVRAVIEQRCIPCHNAQVRHKNVALHTPELVIRQAAAIHQQVVVHKLMPLNNATQMTVEERRLLARWFEAGMPRQ